MKKGFTFIELMISVTIIGLLAMVAIPFLFSSKAKSRDSIRADDLKSLSKAVELYFEEHDYKFPNAISDLGTYYEGGIVPKDPKTGADYSYSVISGGYCFGATTEEISSNGVVCPEVAGTYKVKGP